MSKVVFLDRDGLINSPAEPHCYITSWEEFKFLPGVAQAIKQLNEAQYRVVVVTNQRGVARKLMTATDVDMLHQAMRSALEEQGAHVEAVYVCPHEEGTCDCRKPNIGLFLQAERDFAINKEDSWMVGDSDSDTEAGKRYGIRTLQTNDLSQAVTRILEAST